MPGMTAMRDRDLVRLYWPVELRPAFDALFAIDDAMADVVEKASEATLAAIKLAWWRDRLEELDTGKVPAEPRLKAAAHELLPRGISGAMLSALERGHAALLDPAPDAEAVIGRGASLFHLAGHLLGSNPPDIVDDAGRLYVAGQLRRRGKGLDGLSLATRFGGIPRIFRPLTALAVLAERDLRGSEPEATPARAFALIRHRWTGRIG